jgi:hypothetical protein
MTYLFASMMSILGGVVWFSMTYVTARKMTHVSPTSMYLQVFGLWALYTIFMFTLASIT